MVVQSNITRCVRLYNYKFVLKNHAVRHQKTSSKFHRDLFYDLESSNAIQLKTVPICTGSLMAVNIFMLHIKQANVRFLVGNDPQLSDTIDTWRTDY